MKHVNSKDSTDGITLVSLVVTIIVLLVLVGITINALVGENGIIKKAMEAKGKYDNATQQEQEQLNGIETYMEGIQKNWKSLKEFGAVGDGITDDTQAITRALQSQENGVIIPKGTYIVSQSIEIKNSKTIVGEGEQSVIKLKENSGNLNVIFAKGIPNLKLRNLKIDGNKEGYTDRKAETVCLYLEEADNLILQDLYIENSLIEGVYLYKTKNATVNNLRCQGNGFYQEDASGLHLDTCSNVAVNELYSANNGFHGIILSNSTGVKVQNSNVLKNGYAGIVTQWESNHNTFSNINSLENTYGIEIKTNSNNNMFENCTISKSVGAGIELYVGNDNYLKNCIVTENKYGIRTIVPGEDIYPVLATLRGYNNTFLNNRNESIIEAWAKIDFANSIPNMKIGNYNTTNGEETQGTEKMISDLVPVLYNSKITLNNEQKLTMQVMYYSEDKTFLWHQDNYESGKVFIIDSNQAKYIKIIMQNTGKDNKTTVDINL